MITPTIAALRFLRGIHLGMLLGLFYGFLRPLGCRRRTLSDLIFLAGVFPVWLYFCFAVCQGDFNLGYVASLPIGGILLDKTLGRLLRPVFGIIWVPIWAISRRLRKILKNIFAFWKKLFASGKKMSKIEARKNEDTGGFQNANSSVAEPVSTGT